MTDNLKNLVYILTYYTETSPLICRENQWTGFYMIRTSVIKELKRVPPQSFHNANIFKLTMSIDNVFDYMSFLLVYLIWRYGVSSFHKL